MLGQPLWQARLTFLSKHNYDGLVDKMLAYGNPEQMGYIEYRCLHCGQGQHHVAMSGHSSLCLRCAKVYVDNWVSQVSKMLHEGVIYRHIVLTVPEILRETFYLTFRTPSDNDPRIFQGHFFTDRHTQQCYVVVV